MGKAAYVYSTLASDVKYIEWIKGGGDLPFQGRTVVVKGGTGVANDRFVTPLGVATEVDEDDLSWLEAVPQFQVHKQAGHVTVERKKSDPEKVASNMKLRDKSAPITPSDFESADDTVAKPQKSML